MTTLYSLQAVAGCIFATYLFMFVLYMSTVNKWTGFEQLTEWTFIAWLAYYALIYTCLYCTNNKTVLSTMNIASRCVFAVSMNVLIGSYLLLVFKATIIVESIPKYGIMKVFTVNLIEHFVPPLAFVEFISASTTANTYILNNAKREKYTACILAALFVMAYILLMNPSSVYGITLNESVFIGPLICICVGSTLLIDTMRIK